jgi:flagellar M-ring protein FliF
VQRMLEQIKALYTGLGARERRILTGAVLGSVIALSTVFWWASQESWQVVYSSNNPSDVRSAAETLDIQKIPYRISPDGLRLETTRDNLGRARIQSASAGKIPGYETLSEIKLGTSPQRERWAYQHALEGELTRTVNSLEEVEASRVHLVLPERSAFLREDGSASASITVKLGAGRSLRKDQVQGITALVAGAVDGLNADEVVLVDDAGRLLSAAKDSDDSMLGMPNMFEARQAYETRYRRTVINALTPILGDEGAMSVAVTVDLDPTHVESTVRGMDPDTQVTVSEEVREEESSNQTAGGVPGTESNLPENAGARQGEQNRSTSQLSTNYDYTTTQKRTVQQAGKIERVNVAVMINTERLNELVAAAGDGATSEALQTQIDEAVRVAMGYDKTRGDSVAVSFVPFSTSLASADDLVDESIDLAEWAPMIIALVSLLMFFGFVVMPIVRSVTSGSAGSASQGGLLAATSDRMGADGIKDDEGMSLAERLRLLVDNFEPVEAQDLNRLVELQEDASAQVLRRWVHS